MGPSFFFFVFFLFFVFFFFLFLFFFFFFFFTLRGLRHGRRQEAAAALPFFLCGRGSGAPVSWPTSRGRGRGGAPESAAACGSGRGWRSPPWGQWAGAETLSRRPC